MENTEIILSRFFIAYLLGPTLKSLVILNPK
jgi:hypothetical protein